ncbi:MAG: hypothetical protein ACMXX7_00220 [Candidatus Woesearchaeota archaeon]
MFVEVNEKIYDKKQYFELIQKLELLISGELEEVSRKYGFENFENKNLNLKIDFKIIMINYLKEI